MTVDLDTRPLLAWASGRGFRHLHVTVGGDAPAASDPSGPFAPSEPADLVVVTDAWTDDDRLGAAVLLELAADGTGVTADEGTVGADLAGRLSAAVGAPGSQAAHAPEGHRRRARGPRRVRLAAPPVSRRALLGAAVPLPPPPPSDPGERLAAAVRALTGAPGTSGTPGTPGPAGGLAALPHQAALLRTHGCCGDGLCARACPTGALVLERMPDPAAGARDGGPALPGADAGAARGATRFLLTQLPERCIGCDLCLQVCPHDAMHREGTLTWGDVLGEPRVPLRSARERLCRKCGAPHGGAGDLCPVCERRLADPFAVHWPPLA